MAKKSSSDVVHPQAWGIRVPVPMASEIEALVKKGRETRPTINRTDVCVELLAEALKARREARGR